MKGKMNDYILKSFRVVDDFLEVYILPSNKAIKDELNRIDPMWSFVMSENGNFFTGTLEIMMNGRIIKRSAAIKKRDLDIYAEENNLLTRAALEFDIFRELNGKKLLTKYFKEEKFKYKNREVKKTLIKNGGEQTEVWFAVPTSDEIKKALISNEVLELIPVQKEA